MNRRELGVLNELALLRETIARERNIPLKYVLPDDVLVGIVGLRPASVEELSQLRRLDAGMRKHIGARIIEAVAAGEGHSRGSAAAAGAAAARSPAGTRWWLRSPCSSMPWAAANDLPSTLLVSRNEIERIARDAPQSPEALAALLDLTALAPGPRGGGPCGSSSRGERVLRIAGYAEGVPRTTWETAREESLASE